MPRRSLAKAQDPNSSTVATIGSIECITISDDDSDDEVAFVSRSSANRPSPAGSGADGQRNIATRCTEPPANPATTSSSSSPLKRKDKEPSEQEVQEYAKRLRAYSAQVKTENAAVSGPHQDTSPETSSREAQDMGAKTALKAEDDSRVAPRAAPTPASTSNDVLSSNTGATVDGRRDDAAPTLPTTTGESKPNVVRIECNLAVHAPKASGAREWPALPIWNDPGFDPNLLPFSIHEVPSFGRGTWLSLCMHRYKVASRHYPRNPEAERECAADLKTQLRAMLSKLSAWPEGEEPEISFPRIDKVKLDLIDIKFANKNHHDAARTPLAHQLRIGTASLEPTICGAYVDTSQWLILQFPHPTIRKKRHVPLSAEVEAEIQAETLEFGKQALIAANQHASLRQIGHPVCLWYLPQGYPHRSDIEALETCEEVPEYVLLLRRHSFKPQVTIPPFLKLKHRLRPGFEAVGGSAGRGRPWNGWIKLLWDGRHDDLCNYCKRATDGHTNMQCREERKDKDKRRMRIRPPVY